MQKMLETMHQSNPSMGPLVVRDPLALRPHYARPRRGK
jgi:hypothetical protein